MGRSSDHQIGSKLNERWKSGLFAQPALLNQQSNFFYAKRIWPGKEFCPRQSAVLGHPGYHAAPSSLLLLSLQRYLPTHTLICMLVYMHIVLNVLRLGTPFPCNPGAVLSEHRRGRGRQALHLKVGSSGASSGLHARDSCHDDGSGDDDDHHILFLSILIVTNNCYYYDIHYYSSDYCCWDSY